MVDPPVLSAQQLQVSPDTGWSQALHLVYPQDLAQGLGTHSKGGGKEKWFGLLVKKARERD